MEESSKPHMANTCSLLECKAGCRFIGATCKDHISVRVVNLNGAVARQRIEIRTERFIYSDLDASGKSSIWSKGIKHPGDTVFWSGSTLPNAVTARAIGT